MHKLKMNTLQRISTQGVLNQHKMTDLSEYNRALKIVDRVALTLDEEKQIGFIQHKNGNLTWGMDAEGVQIPDFKDIIAEIELSDEMAELLKKVIDAKIKGGVTLSSQTDKATMEVMAQLQDPARAS